MSGFSRETPATRSSNRSPDRHVAEAARSGNPNPAQAGTVAAGGRGVKLYITRYGFSKKKGGWDGIGDSGTDGGYGLQDRPGHPTLKEGDCALTKKAQRLLGAEPGDLIRAVWENGRIQVYRFNDRAPQQDDDPKKAFYDPVNPARLDAFLPWKDDPSLAGYAYCEVIRAKVV